MPNLFDPMTINKMKLRNRFVRSATMDGLANNGMISDAEIKLYRELAGKAFEGTHRIPYLMR